MDQVLKLGFCINNYNKTKTMKPTNTIYHLLLTQFSSNLKVRYLWPIIITKTKTTTTTTTITTTTTTVFGCDSIEINLFFSFFSDSWSFQYDWQQHQSGEYKGGSCWMNWKKSWTQFSLAWTCLSLLKLLFYFNFYL